MRRKLLRKTLIICMAAMLAILPLSACAKEEPETPEQEEPAEEPEAEEPAEEPPAEEPADTPVEPEEDPADKPAEDARDHAAPITGDFAIDTEVEGGVTQEENLYTITKGGTYALSGRLENGRILVDAGEEKVTLLLTGVSIRSTENAPILAASAGKLTIETAEGVYSEITDGRPRRTVEAEEAKNATAAELTGNGAVYAKCDLKFCGTGYLAVSSSYDNGIHSTKDLTLQDICLSVLAPNNALKGKDSVTVKSGEFVLISSGGDGIKTEATDVSSKEKQRGNVTIKGGCLDIYAACDGIDAAYDVAIEGEPTIRVLTDTYSTYTGEVMESDAEADFYYILSYGDYDENYRYAAYFYNEGQEGVWKEALYETDVYGGMTAYCGLKLSVPAGYSNAAFYVFENGEFSTETYLAASEGGAIDTETNAFMVRGIKDGAMDGSYVSLSTGSEAATYSRKGIKADNAIAIAGGTIGIRSTDDAIHVNAGNLLENGTTGIGSIEISGGALTLATEDDAIHADNAFTLSGGAVKVETSYEGLEANVITVKDGEIDIYATDDGINAAGDVTTSSINVKGGKVVVRTAKGDTDAIDSNGNFTQSGGFVLALGGSGAGAVSGSIDADGTVSVTGGTCVALGGICEIPDGEKDCSMAATTATPFEAGEYEIKNSKGDTVLSFTIPGGSYRGGWICSDAFELEESYSLEREGSEVFSWKQEAKTAGDPVESAPGPGGQGGGPGGPPKP